MASAKKNLTVTSFDNYRLSGVVEHDKMDRICGILLGICRDDGKENGNYYIIIGYILGL